MTVLLDTRVLDEAAARRELRRQIDVLERRGAAARGTDTGPRLLSLGELEVVRDGLLRRTSDVPRPDMARRTFEAMVADPRAHKWRRIKRADIGLPGCGEYRVAKDPSGDTQAACRWPDVPDP